MKLIRRSIPSVLFSAPFLFFILVLIALASFLLANSGFEGLLSTHLFTSPQGLLVLVIGPFALFVLLGLLLYSVVSHALHTAQATRFGHKLFVTMAVLIACASIPSGIIVSRFATTVIGSWFDREVSRSLSYAAEMADLYTAERIRDIEKVASRFFNGLAIANNRSRPADWMSDIRLIDAYAASCQVYAIEGDGFLPVVEYGDSSLFYPRSALDRVRDGFFVWQEDESVFRYGKTVHYSNSVYVCVYTSLIPSSFHDKSRLIQDARIKGDVIRILEPFLPFLGVWVYFLFCFPSVVMTIILAYYLSVGVSAPVASAAEAATRLEQGTPSLRPIVTGNDEVAGLCNSLNRLCDAADGSKKKDKKAVIRL